MYELRKYLSSLGGTLLVLWGTTRMSYEIIVILALAISMLILTALGYYFIKTVTRLLQ